MINLKLWAQSSNSTPFDLRSSGCSLYFVFAFEMIIGWKTPKTSNRVEDFLIGAYPLLVLVFSMFLLIGFMVSNLRLGEGQNIQFSKKRSIAIEYSPSIQYILIFAQNEGLAYNRAVAGLRERIHELRPAVQHTVMILIDWVDNIIRRSSESHIVDAGGTLRIASRMAWSVGSSFSQLIS